MNIIKIIGLLSGLSFVAYILVLVAREIVIYAQANDDIDPVEIENRVFEEIANERKNRNAWYSNLFHNYYRFRIYGISDA